MKELVKPIAEDALNELGRSSQELSVIDVAGPEAAPGAVGIWERFRVTRIQLGSDIFEIDLTFADYLNLLWGNTDKVRQRILNELRLLTV